MAEQRPEAARQVGYKVLQLLKDETLGIGSYGSVCKARYDNLLCAAKILHPTLFDPTSHKRIARNVEHRLPIRRFEQECEFMSAIRHPNIVQYLGTCQDPETRLPVLLMELMDDSLTHFLESSQQPVPYHIQVNFCHDITLALSFLHENNIIHRDLSSNNVLLIGNVRAKVTDFGMAKLSDTSPERTRTFTLCPGTDSFMPPEAAKNVPEYTEKIDCFSFGVLTIQILTRKFPKPADRLKEVDTVDPQFAGSTIEVRVSELERRQAHIQEIDGNDPLLLIALDCLKDRDLDRPSSLELCVRVVALKDTPEYEESVRSIEEKEDRLREELQQQHTEEIDDLKLDHAKELEAKDDTIAAHLEEKDVLKEQQAREIQQLREQLETAKGKEITRLLREHSRELQVRDMKFRAEKAKAYQLTQVLQQTRKQDEKQHKQQTKERDDMIAARQVENQCLRQEIGKLKGEHDQQIKERDDTIAARQEENQRLRQEIGKLKGEHDQQIKERNDTIIARQKEIQHLKVLHAKQMQDQRKIESNLETLLLLQQYPVDDFPDYKTQKTELHAVLQQRLKKGDTWYLVDERWMKQWKKYVGYDQWDQESTGQESANPGPVDNANLFKDRVSETLREHLMEELNYTLLPEAAWLKLILWYGITQDSKPVARKVVEHGVYMKHCKVEVYLLQLKLCLHPNLMDTVTREFSRADTPCDLESALREVFNVDKDTECRVWHRYMNRTCRHTYGLLSEQPSQTLAGLCNGQNVLLEKRNEDGSWPRQSVKPIAAHHKFRTKIKADKTTD